MSFGHTHAPRFHSLPRICASRAVPSPTHSTSNRPSPSRLVTRAYCWSSSASSSARCLVLSEKLRFEPPLFFLLVGTQLKPAPLRRGTDSGSAAVLRAVVVRSQAVGPRGVFAQVEGPDGTCE